MLYLLRKYTESSKIRSRGAVPLKDFFLGGGKFQEEIIIITNPIICEEYIVYLHMKTCCTETYTMMHECMTPAKCIQFIQVTGSLPDTMPNIKRSLNDHVLMLRDVVISGSNS